MHLFPTRSDRREFGERERPLHAFLAGGGAILLLAIVAAGCSDTSLPPIPQPSLDGFAAAVQDQLRSGRADAEANPVDAAAIGRFGRVLYTYGQFRAAAECFERCRSLEPEEFEWAYLLGVVRGELGQSDLARASIR